MFECCDLYGNILRKKEGYGKLV